MRLEQDTHGARQTCATSNISEYAKYTLIFDNRTLIEILSCVALLQSGNFTVGQHVLSAKVYG